MGVRGASLLARLRSLRRTGSCAPTAVETGQLPKRNDSGCTPSCRGLRSPTRWAHALPVSQAHIRAHEVVTYDHNHVTEEPTIKTLIKAREG